jgi:hypothetical protein
MFVIIQTYIYKPTPSTNQLCKKKKKTIIDHLQLYL